MKARTAFLLAMALNPLAARADVMPRELVISLSREDIVRIRPNRDTTQASFDRDWGQFEVLVPKERFPIPAPNCRKNVILRMPAVGPDAPDRERRVEWRWTLFRALHDLASGRIEEVETALLPGPYMKTDGSGRPVLEYCNAYFNDKAPAGR